jgi:hypothetical protein
VSYFVLLLASSFIPHILPYLLLGNLASFLPSLMLVCPFTPYCHVHVSITWSHTKPLLLLFQFAQSTTYWEKGATEEHARRSQECDLKRSGWLHSTSTLQRWRSRILQKHHLHYLSCTNTLLLQGERCTRASEPFSHSCNWTL